MARKPNVIVFFTDQQRHDSTGVHGNPLDLTPNFDRIARAGTDVHYSFTCAPVCGPARCCLQTGTHISTNGAYQNGFGIPDNMPTLAQQFNNAGYRTGYIGKWHLAGKDGHASDKGERGPVAAHARGGYQDWLAVEALEFSVNEYKVVLYDNDNKPVQLPGYRVDALTDAGIRYIDRNKDEPFFLTMSFIEPHHQNDVDDYPPPDGYREKYQGRYCPPDLAALPSWSYQASGDESKLTHGGSTHAHLGGYWGQVKRLDEAFGRLIDALKSLDLLDDTIILFTSDHACHFKTRNGEYKRSVHESSIRVPTLLYGGPFTNGGRLSQLVSLVDLPPTLLDAAGLDVPDTMEGHSLVPIVERDREAITAFPDEMYVQVCDAHHGRAIRTHRWKYGVLTEPGVKGAPTFDTYIETHLYDLKYDPHELTNLIDVDSHTPVREVMRQRLLKRMATLGEPTPMIVEPEKLRGGGQRSVSQTEAQS